MPIDGIPDVLQPQSEAITVFGPASLSNLGPGFDTLGLCIGTLGDQVDAWRVDEPGVHLLDDATGASFLPMEPAANTASVAAAVVWEQTGTEAGIALRIRKGIPIGSGIGGSAASAVAGAWAANLVLDAPLTKAGLVEAVLAGEAIASGCRHGDNVLPALFGGLVLVSPTEPTCYRRIPLPRPLYIALLLPDVPILTKQARDILPVEVPRGDAIGNTAALAFMIDAFRCGDWTTVGRCIMQDRIVEPVRARLVPCYEAVRRAALEAGAPGCALTGSGPAMFAIAETTAQAQQALEAMLAACRGTGIAANGFVTPVDEQGAHAVAPAD